MARTPSSGRCWCRPGWCSRRARPRPRCPGRPGRRTGPGRAARVDASRCRWRPRRGSRPARGRRPGRRRARPATGCGRPAAGSTRPAPARARPPLRSEYRVRLWSRHGLRSRGRGGYRVGATGERGTAGAAEPSGCGRRGTAAWAGRGGHGAACSASTGSTGRYSEPIACWRPSLSRSASWPVCAGERVGSGPPV